jgi:hypothetical protein
MLSKMTLTNYDAMEYILIVTYNNYSCCRALSKYFNPQYEANAISLSDSKKKKKKKKKKKNVSSSSSNSGSMYPTSVISTHQVLYLVIFGHSVKN